MRCDWIQLRFETVLARFCRLFFFLFMEGLEMESSSRRAASASVSRKRVTRATQEANETARLVLSPVAFRVHRASGAAMVRSASALTDYSRRSCWESYVRETETIVLELETKTLLSEVCFLNKNACTVDVSIGVEDRPRSYINVQRKHHLPHTREVRLKLGFFPCSFVKLEFRRLSQPSIAVYGIKLLGVASRDIEQDSGPSLCNLLSHTTEHLLYGPSLRMSLPYRDCLSEKLSGSPEWMERQRTYLLDERIARLERTLFSTSLT